MEAISRRYPAPQEPDENQNGYIGQVQRHLIGHRSSRWLEDNIDTVFGIVDQSIDHASQIQGEITNLLECLRTESYPVRMVDGPDGKPVEREMDQIATLKLAVDLLATVMPIVEKVITSRNKVAMGATNILTAAVMGSNAIRMQSMRQERSANPQPRKRYGAGARIVIEGDAEVVES